MKSLNRVIFCCLLFGLCSCAEKVLFEGKALVLLSGSAEGQLFTEQKAFVAVGDKEGGAWISKTKLPQYPTPAQTGDSVEVKVTANGFTYGKIYHYTPPTFSTYVYYLETMEVSRKLLFHRGIVVLGEFREPQSLEFYHYAYDASKEQLDLTSIGGQQILEPFFSGSLGADSIVLQPYRETYYLRK